MVYIWNDPSEVPADFGPSVVTIGNFDGVHRGHQQVLSELIRTARITRSKAVVVTFDPHPALVHLASLTPEEFVEQYLVDCLHAGHVVIGHDVRFGRGNSGDLDTMRELGRKFGFEVQVIREFGSEGYPLHDDDGEDRRCSSTWVREALQEGDVATASAVLGRPHRMRGEVVHGAARGRALGFPTANLASNASGLIPADGIYAGWLVDQAGTRWPAAISVGSNPTFDGVSRQVEAHVIDRPKEDVEDFDLYGQTVVVEFVARLRGMVAYRGPEALVEQMRLDVVQAHELLARR
jgi:riboflavin kinase/FMN adenylyltransferase